MKYTSKSFTVPAVEKPPEKCDHARPWLDKWGRCVMCGEAGLCPHVWVWRAWLPGSRVRVACAGCGVETDALTDPADWRGIEGVR